MLRKIKANYPVDSSMAQGFDATSKSARRSEQPTILQPAVDAEQVQQQWISQFQNLEDPRGLQGTETGCVAKTSGSL